MGRQVAALHSSGSISVWDVPSLRKRKFWSLENQPGFDSQNFETNYLKKVTTQEITPIHSLKNHLVDVKWWSEKSVILARFSGAVTVCSVNSLTNLLGESPEFFEGVPQVLVIFNLFLKLKYFIKCKFFFVCICLVFEFKYLGFGHVFLLSYSVSSAYLFESLCLFAVRELKVKKKMHVFIPTKCNPLFRRL